MPRIKQRTHALRERALAAALALLAEEGVAGLTTRSVAGRAGASVPAIYEVFGDKAGLVREVFFEGFRMLGDVLAVLPPTGDPLEDLERLADGYRAFVLDNSVLADVMFSRPFADFDPSSAEDQAGVRVRKIFVDRVRATTQAGLIGGNPTDVALVFFALLEGLVAAESARRLGSTTQSVNRRWRLGTRALLAGLRP